MNSHRTHATIARTTRIPWPPGFLPHEWYICSTRTVIKSLTQGRCSHSSAKQDEFLNPDKLSLLTQYSNLEAQSANNIFVCVCVFVYLYLMYVWIKFGQEISHWSCKVPAFSLCRLAAQIRMPTTCVCAFCRLANVNTVAMRGLRVTGQIWRRLTKLTS